MARTRLLQAVCTVAMLAATPAFAQTSPSSPGATGAQDNPASHQPPVGAGSDNAGTPAATTATPGTTPGTTASGTSASDRGTMGSAEPAPHHAMHHRSAVRHSTARNRGTAAGNEAVDRLNEQSYQAAQKGQPFSSGTSDNGANGPAGTITPSSGAGGGPK